MSVSWLYNWFLWVFFSCGWWIYYQIDLSHFSSEGSGRAPDSWPLLNPHWLHAPAREPRSPGSLVSHLPFFLWTLTWEQHRNKPPNAEEELPAAVPVLPLWAELLRSLPKQARARVAPQPDGAIGGRKEWRFQRIPEGQERLGVEPVLCAWGVHGLGPTVCWKGKKRFLNMIAFQLQHWLITVTAFGSHALLSQSQCPICRPFL